MDISHSLEKHFRLLPQQKAALAKLGVRTIEDLLYHFPARYGDTVTARAISNLAKGDSAVIFGTVSKLKTSKGFRSRIPMGEGLITDDTGSIKAVWFNQPYLAKMIPDGAFVRVEGKVSERRAKSAAGSQAQGALYLSNPKIETVAALPTAVGESLFGGIDGANGTAGTPNILYPVYPESRGITSNWIYHAIQRVFKSGALESLVDPIPDDILERYNLPSLATAMIWIHAPQNADHALAARKRFAFEEVFFIQLERQREKKEWQKNPAFVIEPAAGLVDGFVSRFPFLFTDAQTRAVGEILRDFKKGHAMSRLLEGDVGSGKTAVAATTAFAAIMTKPRGRDGRAAASGSLQVAYMAPTEILASQHFESFIEYLAFASGPSGAVQVGLITGSGCRKFPAKTPTYKNGVRQDWTDISRVQLLKWVANGEIPILVGTHALIQKSVRFKNLAYVIVDEQHRFGTAQRAKLVGKNETDSRIAPHLLSMTATPIPRTLALTIYGDLDLTVLDSMPHGRKPIITEVVAPDRRDETYEKIRAEIRRGRQAYIICPRIDEPDPTKELSVQAKSVKEEAKRLKANVFPEYEIGILHSKMRDAEKERVMDDFKTGRTHILVATSVVEVGVNVPNATVILIEGAERFGLAQLHQLRGRVVRSNHQAYCFVLPETRGDKTVERLRALTGAKNGFELAEYDLKFRGAGELSGRRQWGVSDVAMEALQNIKMVEAARAEAIRIIEEGGLEGAGGGSGGAAAKYPALAAELGRRAADRIHFE
ncbi:MAG: ATP-dependent DNA helicase RecG [Patescibacteria group bacterium]|nr:ATP-dependent DNA helicase RecG [Patescibacteria group bacterium]MDE2116641.1 ATP-dependent DNA helicase RecG [Patescibacteria group bacterium]